MFKKICTLLVSFVFICLVTNNILAEEEIDMNEWKFIQLESNGEHTISKYISKKDPNKYGFCIEPGQHFNKQKTYYKKLLDDDYIFDIVKAYDEYGLILDDESKTFNYYIATQILIWEHINNGLYEFSKDYSLFKQELTDYINMQNKPLLTKSSPNTLLQLDVGEIETIDVDYDKYEIIADEGIEILENSNDFIKYKITNSNPEYKKINIIPKYDPKDYAFVYCSQDSQDIYCFEGEYDVPKAKTFSLFTPYKEPQFIDILYSKKDTNDNPIEGAKFTLYQLNEDNYDTELIFINTDTEINLLDVIFDDYSSYNNLSIEISERYSNYLDGFNINTPEIGYFPYKIYNDGILIKEGRCYVSNDINQTNGTYTKNHVLTYFEGNSEAININTINSVENNNTYYLCESEPKKGYEYTHNACKLIDASTYNSEVIKFVNSQRTYTLRLMKQSPFEVLLDGAKFKITYLDGDDYKNLILTTGYLNIERKDNNKFLIYKYENENEINIVEFDGDYYSTRNIKNGKYYYYQSNDPNINESKLNNDYTYVIKGGFCIENMPYSSSLTIEELIPPKGFMITEPIYYISPDISYSEITFRNFRVNEFEILPKKKFKIPQTCIKN